MANEKLIESLPDSICWRIASKLDVQKPPNWKTLIECIRSRRYNEKKILTFHLEILKPGGSPTLALLSDLGKKTVNQLVTWLIQLQAFPDLVDLVQRGEDYIRELSVAILSQPISDVYDVGQNIVINFEVSGERPLSFQWFKGVLLLQNQTRNALQLKNAKLEDSGYYTCRISNQYGHNFTDWIKVDVCDTPYPEFNEPLIIMHPRSVVCEIGDTICLQADAVGNPAPHIQWIFDNEPITGQCNRDLIIRDATPSQHEGLYKLKASNKHGTATSMPGQVTVVKSGTDRVMIINEKTLPLSIKSDLELGRGSAISPIGEPTMSIIPPERPSEKVALLIGNEDYAMREKLGHLVHPVNDTFDLAAALISIDFKVVSLVNLDLEGMKNAVRFFFNLINHGTYALFYFAGHGFEASDESYLMPVDATENYLPSENISVSRILQAMTHDERQGKLSVLLLDCCRTEPAGCRLDPMPKLRNIAVQRKNVVIGYGCCSKGRVFESPSMRNGYFAHYLVQNITKDIKIDDVLFEVSRAIHQEKIIDPATGRTQVVYRNSTVTDDLRLTQKVENAEKECISSEYLLWQQAHIAPDSPVTILDTECVTVELIFTAQFSNCLIIQSSVKKSSRITSCDIMFILPQQIGGAKVEKISKECKKGITLKEKVVRISNLERLDGDINIHLQLTLEEDGLKSTQNAHYCIKEKPLYAKIMENLDRLKRDYTS